MSLQVWLPLNGNLNNQGLSSSVFINTGATIDSSGKIGQCYSFTSGNFLQSTLSLSSTGPWSAAAWICPAEQASSGHQYIIGLNGTTASDFLFNLCVYTNKISVRFAGTTYQATTNYTINTWYHACFTYDGTQLKIYINGELNKTFTSTVAPKAATNLYIGKRGGNTGYYVGKLNDVRIYDHCLSPKEVEEISKGLVLHYKLDSIINNKIYDCSGYQNNGTPTNISFSSASIRYSNCAIFNGSSSYIAAGRGAMVKDAISVCCWAYMTNWANYTARLLSCTEGGGWNFEPSSGKLNFAMGTGTSSNTYKGAVSTRTLASLSSGWHYFVGTYDGFSTKIYIDGNLEGTNTAYTTKTPIYYSSTNGIFIGAEAAGTTTTPATTANTKFNGNMSDVRIYATALSIDAIKELYNTSVTIDNQKNIYARELVEV